MNRNEKLNYLIAAGIGVVVGGILIAFATDAIPKMMEKVSNTMMGKMMERMGKEGCTPEEM